MSFDRGRSLHCRRAQLLRDFRLFPRREGDFLDIELRELGATGRSERDLWRNDLVCCF
jgi:hypothetical protein